jgi:hypothetical protein
MDRSELDQLEAQLARLVQNRFADDPVRRVAVLQYGEDPAIEPGELLVRVFIKAAGDGERRKETLDEFDRVNRVALTDFRRDLNMFRGIGPVEFIAGPGDSGDELQPMMRWGPHALSLAGPGTGGSAIVPVMARLGPADLETLDTLITAGIAANRADAVRWALARIRDRPAYARLRERAREIEELKAQF